MKGVPTKYQYSVALYFYSLSLHILKPIIFQLGKCETFNFFFTISVLDWYCVQSWGKINLMIYTKWVPAPDQFLMFHYHDKINLMCSLCVRFYSEPIHGSDL